MDYNELTVRFCGIAGDGVVVSSRILAGACSELGLYVMVNDIYSAEIRGNGKSTSTVRFSTDPLYSMGDGIDMLVAMASQESISELGDLESDGSVIYESSGIHTTDAEKSVAAHLLPEQHGHSIPLKEVANQATGTNKGRNLAAIGALCYIYSLPPTVFKNQITNLFKRKGDKVVNSNLKAFDLGYNYCEENYPLANKFNLEKTHLPRKLISGNEAIAKGAIDCGLHFFGGYPITPATKIMEIAAKELPKHGGWVIQTEDEIAALGTVIGAGYAGTRAMTSTSGPGLSLMSELINYAVMAEIPLVIVNVQRGGPATGLPTKVEQGDLNIALYGGSGDSPRVVIAPSNSQECYEGIQLAFDIAEEYQTPVIFLSDLFLGQRVETDLTTENVNRKKSTRVKPKKTELENYRRFKITDSGVSPLVVPGEPGAYYTITGLEHNEKGNPNYESELHLEMTKKRYRKLETLEKKLNPPEFFGDKDARIGLVSWGSTVGAIKEAMLIAESKGVKSKLINSIMIHPQQEDAFQEFFESCDEIIIPEMNFQGQYAALLKSRYGIKPVEIHIPSVNPASPIKIAEKILEVNDELS